MRTSTLMQSDTLMFIAFDITIIVGIILFVVLEYEQGKVNLSNAYNSYLELQKTL